MTGFDAPARYFFGSYPFLTLAAPSRVVMSRVCACPTALRTAAAVSCMLLAIHAGFGGQELADWAGVLIKVSVLILLNLFVNGAFRIGAKEPVR